ncbi:MAG: preprotein translocase subunit YajC [Streptococcaceae bacterium]|nr:preprotein translocase subunit YajC [Streptococcaceae bacterium]
MQIILNCSIVLLVLILIMFSIYTFVSFRQLKARTKQIEALHQGLSVGQKVLFSGGLTGIISKIEREFVNIRVADNVELEVSRYAITEILT